MEKPILYFVQTRFPGEHEVYSSLKTAAEIIERVSMYDCYDEELIVFDIKDFGNPVPLNVRGTWHKEADPLYIAAYDPNGNVVFSGHGTEH